MADVDTLMGGFNESASESAKKRNDEPCLCGSHFTCMAMVHDDEAN